MLKINYVQCEKCGKIFKKMSGGIVMNPNDYENICDECKSKGLKNVFKRKKHI